MTIGGEEVLNEHLLLAYTENGEMMDSPLSVRFLVIHCSATRADRNYTDTQLMRDHKKRGFRTVGYHFQYLHASLRQCPGCAASTRRSGGAASSTVARSGMRPASRCRTSCGSRPAAR